MPIDRSLLRPFNWTLTFDRIKDFVFFVQEIMIPEMSIDTLSINQDPTEWRAPGDKIIYGPSLDFTVLLDERLTGFENLYQWFWDIRNPVDNRFHKPLSECFSDCSVTIRGNNQQTIGVFRFVDCFPMRLGAPVLKSTDPEDNIMTSQCSVGFLRYEWIREGFPVIPAFATPPPP